MGVECGSHAVQFHGAQLLLRGNPPPPNHLTTHKSPIIRKQLQGKSGKITINPQKSPKHSHNPLGPAGAGRGSVGTVGQGRGTYRK